MPRTPKPPAPMGRTKIPIDWDEVDKYLIAGSPGTAIAAIYGYSVHTLYDRCVAEHGVTFSEYSRQKKSKGDELLRMKQFSEAMKGDKTLLIWLGKNRLQQKEKHELTHEGKMECNIVNYGDSPIGKWKNEEEKDEIEKYLPEKKQND